MNPAASALGLLVPRLVAPRYGVVGVAVASRILGTDFESVLDLADPIRGVSRIGLIWVFNVAVNGEGAEASYRFWAKELEAFHNPDERREVQSQMWDTVVDELLPAKASFHAREVECLLNCSAATVLRLENRGELPRELSGRFSRKTLDDFLNRRLLDAGDQRKNKP